eukprot:4358472-Amphidinium_carterae.1
MAPSVYASSGLRIFMHVTKRLCFAALSWMMAIGNFPSCKTTWSDNRRSSCLQTLPKSQRPPSSNRSRMPPPEGP